MPDSMMKRDSLDFALEIEARVTSREWTVEKLADRLEAFRLQTQEAPKAASQSLWEILEKMDENLVSVDWGEDGAPFAILDKLEAYKLLEADRAAQRQVGREERCDNCDRDSAINAFRMDELDAVMMSVDKWLSGQALRNNPATRAADAREVALKAIEAVATAQAQRYAELVEVLEEILPVEGTGEGLAPYYIHSNTIKRGRKAMSALDEGRKG